jgi:hypothetical protein
MNDERIQTISEMLPDVPLHLLPSVWQYDRCKDWVTWADGADPEGNFLGSCLLHDREKTMTSAVYNFDRGVMRCQGDNALKLAATREG